MISTNDTNNSSNDNDGIPGEVAPDPGGRQAHDK